MRFAGTRVLITGAARGIGAGIARRFLEEGAHVVALDYREEQLAQLAGTYNSNPATAARFAYVTGDLRDPQVAEQVIAEAWQHWDGIDILVNNAGIALLEPFVDIPYERWSDILNVNLNSVFTLSQAIAKRWIAAGIQGTIVNMASKNGLVGQSLLAHYNASKGGVVLLTQTLAVELAEHGIRVNAVAPGFIDTPLNTDAAAKRQEPGPPLARTPLKRLGTVDEVANVVLFLASQDASYVTGETIVVDGGHLANSGAV